MLDKSMSIADAVDLVRDGDTVLFGGWGASRKPMAIVRELVCSDLKELTIVTMGGLDADFLIAAGKVQKVIYGFLGYHQLPGIPGRCRQARQDGSVEMVELSEGMFVLGLKAAAEGLPFLPTRSGLGTDILTVSPYIKTIECPYTGTMLVAVPAISADIAFLHVNAASISGYGKIVGDAWLDRIMARAAKKAIISTERIVTLAEMKKDHPMIKISRLWIDGVIEAPYGAHPTSCFPDYGVDRVKLGEYTSASATSDSADAYIDKYIRNIDSQVSYIDLMGGAARLSQIKYS